MKATAAPTTNGHVPATTLPARTHRKPPKPALPAQPNTLLETILFAASDPAIDIAKVEHLIRLRREMEAAEAERAFNDALAAAQAGMQPIVADARNDQTGSRFASFVQVDKAIRPIYSQHGLNVTWTTGERSGDAAVEVVGYLIGHGHSRRYSISMPCDGKGARGGDVMTRTHATAAACSYAMRYLTLMMFNLSVDKDDDGNAASAIPAKPASSASLKRSGIWGTFETEMRAAKSLPVLEAVCERWRVRVAGWSSGYKTAAVELKGQQIERLGGTLAQLEESAERLEHDRERRQMALEEDAAERRYQQHRPRY